MSELRIEDREGVRWVMICRPETRNSLTVPLVERLAAVFAEAGADAAARAVVVAGEGGAFCSGLDLKSSFAGPIDPQASIVHFHDLIRNLRRMRKPTIAAIDGAAAGFGADMALAADLRIASARASLGERFVRIGLMPDGGGTFFLPRLVGLGRAFELLYEGRMVEATEAAQLGLVNRVLPVEGFFEAVQTYAAGLAKGPPLAYARIKESVLHSLGDLEESLAAEREGQLSLLATADFQEGVAAFLERRAPRFTGR